MESLGIFVVTPILMTFCTHFDLSLGLGYTDSYDVSIESQLGNNTEVYPGYVGDVTLRCQPFVDPGWAIVVEHRSSVLYKDENFGNNTALATYTWRIK